MVCRTGNLDTLTLRVAFDTLFVISPVEEVRFHSSVARMSEADHGFKYYNRVETCVRQIPSQRELQAPTNPSTYKMNTNDFFDEKDCNACKNTFRADPLPLGSG